MLHANSYATCVLCFAALYWTQGPGRQQPTLAAAAADGSPHQQPDLSQVGLVLWQSGYVLSDFLLLRLQAAGGAVGSSGGCGAGGWGGSNGSSGSWGGGGSNGSYGGWGGGGAGSSGSWAGVRFLELGCGGGTCGMFLALAGAQVSHQIQYDRTPACTAAAVERPALTRPQHPPQPTTETQPQLVPTPTPPHRTICS
jgi:hypothetical protein